MSRKARVRSNSGIYHVLVRAVANLPLFTDDEDRQFYVRVLTEQADHGHCRLFAYSLHPTHIHLLLQEDGETVGQVIKRIAAAYSYFFNVKYDHYGPIYQDRFKSEPVETRPYFLRVLDFIGSQPVEPAAKAILTHVIPSLPEGDPAANAQLSILNFSQRPLRITDSRLLEYLRQTYAFTNIGEFQQRSEADRLRAIIDSKAQGGSIRQIARLTGSPFQFVFQARPVG